MSKSSENKRLRFSAADDICVLREVLGSNPFEDPKCWIDICRVVNFTTNKTFSLRCVREHVEHLLKLYTRDDRANIRKSSSEEQYLEKLQLLQSIAELKKGFKKTPKTNIDVSKNQENAADVNALLSVELNEGFSTTSETPMQCVPGPSHMIHREDMDSPQRSVESAELHGMSDKPSQTLALEFLEGKYKADIEYQEKKLAVEKEYKEKKLKLKEIELQLKEKQLKLEEEKFQLESTERLARIEMEKARLQAHNEQNRALLDLLSNFMKK